MAAVQYVKSKASVGGAAVVMGRPDLGYRPGDLNASFQVIADDLDGGTFDVLLYVSGSPTPRAHVSGAVETDTVIVDVPQVDAFRVEFAGLGGAAAPVVRVAHAIRV